MIAAVTDLSGVITGAHRTWLARDGFGKAPVDTPRRPWAVSLGHAVRFGAVDDVLAVGEGIETTLSLRCALPAMPMAAALSANHLAALLLPPTLRRLYIARDADAAGDTALAALTERAEAAGLEALALSPRTGDFNEDLPLGPRRAASGAAYPTRPAGCRSLYAPGNGKDGVTNVGSWPSWSILRSPCWMKPRSPSRGLSLRCVRRDLDQKCSAGAATNFRLIGISERP